MAAHDVRTERAVYATAAFDLNATDPLAAAQGLEDWRCFLSHRNVVHATTTQMPLSWGMLADDAQNHLAALLTPEAMRSVSAVWGRT